MSEPTMRHIRKIADPVAAGPKGVNYLLVIAIDKYSRGGRPPEIVNGVEVKSPTFSDLENPVIDAARLVNALSRYDFDIDVDGVGQNELKGYGPLKVFEYDTPRTKCLYNEQAKAKNILKQLRAIEKVIKPEDSLLIYFAGHGDDNEIIQSGCFIPFDGVMGENEENTWFEFEKLYTIFNYPKCKHLLLIADCCYAGAAAKGTATQQGGDFSRKLLVSSSTSESASDGEAGIGSPFSQALAFMLAGNSHPEVAIDLQLLEERFVFEYGKMHEAKPPQHLRYSNLPVNCGEGHFIFELKNKDTPPPHILADSFVKYLNFKKEKDLVEASFSKLSKAEISLIITREPNYVLHELLRSVMFTELANYDRGDQEKMRISSCTRKMIPLDLGNDIWQLVISSFSDPGTTGPEKMISNIVGQLLDKPMIISLSRKDLDKNFAQQILNFCKQFVDLVQLEKEKRKVQAAEPEKYYKLFLVIPDSRLGGNDFFQEQEVKQLIDTRYHIIINTPSSELEKTSSLKWFNAVTSSIPSRHVKALKADDFFLDESKTYLLMDFIYSVCDQVKVDKPEVERAIMNY